VFQSNDPVWGEKGSFEKNATHGGTQGFKRSGTKHCLHLVGVGRETVGVLEKTKFGIEKQWSCPPTSRSNVVVKKLSNVGGKRVSNKGKRKKSGKHKKKSGTKTTL